MNRKCVVGLDISSTATGLCVVDLEGNYLFAYLIIAKQKDFDERVISIFNELQKIIEDMADNIVAIGVEAISFGSRGKVVNLAMQNGHIFYTLLCNGYKVTSYPPQTIKKFATGNGRASKEEVINTLPKEVLEDFKVINSKKIDDLADSYYIAKLTLKNYLEKGIDK